jgi:hypothetical protein
MTFSCVCDDVGDIDRHEDHEVAKLAHADFPVSPIAVASPMATLNQPQRWTVSNSNDKSH